MKIKYAGVLFSRACWLVGGLMAAWAGYALVGWAGFYAGMAVSAFVAAILQSLERIERASEQKDAGK